MLTTQQIGLRADGIKQGKLMNSEIRNILDMKLYVIVYLNHIKYNTYEI